jgi:hypothetical protein
MDKKIVLIALLNFSVLIYSQNKFKSIYIDVLKESYLPTKLMCYDTVVITKNKLFRFYLINEKGEMLFEIIENKKIIIKGKYSNSLDVFKEYGESFDLNGNSKIIVADYYYPLKDSVWTFYDYKTKKSRQKKYDKGIQR